MTDLEKLPAYARKAYARIGGADELIRTSSDCDEAVTRGGGFLFTFKRSGRPFPSGSARLLIEAELLVPVGDGLLAEVSQSFRRAP